MCICTVKKQKKVKFTHFWAQLRLLSFEKVHYERFGGSISSVSKDLAWEPKGHQLKSHTDQCTECGLVAGDVPLSKAPDLQQDTRLHVCRLNV